MKAKTVVLCCLIGIVLLCMRYEYSRAESDAGKIGLEIGVVSIQKVFENCKKNARYIEGLIAERQKAEAELRKLSKEIEAADAGLRTLKTESSDYMAQVKESLIKRANLQAQQEFYKRQMELKEQRWTEQLYGEILQQTRNIAQEKNLDFVFENSEPELPAPTIESLVLTIRAHKLLYSGNCLDITEEVIARIDADESTK